MTRPTIFTIAATWDADLDLWVGVCDAIPAAAEAPTLDELLERIGAMTADVLGDNHPGLDPESVFLQITALREMGRQAAAA